MEKRTIAVILAAIILIPLSVWLSADHTTIGSATAAETDFRNTVTVTGEGKIYAPADEAVLNIGVTSVANTATKALGMNSASINKVLSALKASGLSEEEIQTGNVSVFPQQDWQNGRLPKIIGYTAQNQLIIRTMKLGKLGTIIDNATKAGATDTSNLQFQISEDNAAVKLALKKAVARAKSQATTLVQEVGKNLGNATIINQGSSSGPIVPMMYKSSVAMDQAAAPTVIPQDVQVIATVTVTYDMN